MEFRRGLQFDEPGEELLASTKLIAASQFDNLKCTLLLYIVGGKALEQASDIVNTRNSKECSQAAGSQRLISHEKESFKWREF